MKLALTVLVRDEQDIIRPFLEYHLNRGVDFVIATDNLSEDGTRDILEEYRRYGNLHYIYEPADDYSQKIWVTRMARLAATEYGADWVINSDADEFWWPVHKADIKQVLSDVPESISALCVERTNFPPRPRVESQGFLHCMTIRELQSKNSLGHPLPPKVCHRAHAEIVVEQGNHLVSLGGEGLGAVATDEISIFHFPMRFEAQFRRKIEKGGAAYERSQLPLYVGETWRRLYKRHRENEDLDAYFEEQVLDDEKLAQALASGEMVEDRRLLEFMSALGKA